MADYYRKTVNKVVNDVKLKMQLGALTLKLSENNNKIDDLIGVDKSIKKDISTNTGKIDTNTSNINEIKADLSNIDFNSGNKFSIENFFIYNIEIENSYKLDKDKTSFSIFKYTLEDDFKKDSILEIDCRLLYRYHNYNRIGLLQHVFKLYDDNDNMFYDYKSLKTNAGDNTRNDIKQNDFFYLKLNNDYKIIKIELILSLIDGVSNTSVVDCKIYNSYKSNFLSVKYYKKINLISVHNNLGDIENDILSNLGKIDTNEKNISSNLTKIDTNKNDISTNLGKISTNTSFISTNSGQISTNENNISSNLGKINNITKTIMLKNIYFTDFDFNKNEDGVKELLRLDNTPDRPRVGVIDTVNMGYNFKKGDFIEIDCKLMMNHNSYDNAKNCLIYYDLYNEDLDKNKLLFKEIRHYNQFPLEVGKDRIIAYSKICYKVKDDISNTRFTVIIQAVHKKMHLVINHYIIKHGTNYISVKHY